MENQVNVELPTPRHIKAKDVFATYFLEKYKDTIMDVLLNPQDENLPFQVNFSELMQKHVEVAEAVLSKPERLVPVMQKALITAQEELLRQQTQLLPTMTVKKNLHPRLVGVPCPPETKVPRAADVGALLCFSGTVVRTTVPRLLRHTTVYSCDACHHTMSVKAEHDQYYHLSKPSKCRNPDIACFSRQFSCSMSADAENTTDYQEIKLQELLGGGGAASSMPQCVWVTLHHDLVDSCKPGDDVLVCGSVVRRWKTAARDTRPTIDIVIKANNITVRNKQDDGGVVTPELEQEFESFWRQHSNCPLTGRDTILASVCPQMYGLFLVKLAVGVVVAGGVQRVDQSGTRVRGEPHLLLVGDPGTGKSQLLQWACSVGCRSVLTTGVGSTAAGLTVAAVREPGGDWGLEAGALVLADGGLCCIDEFNSVRENDRAAIHEAMEQQTISVAKAGMVCKLNSRCSILAATNPKGRYDSSEPLNLNVGVASPLLSRFDLILILRDTNNPNWDKLVSSYILSGGAPGSAPFSGSAKSTSLWSHEKMRSYFRYIRRLQPKLSADANAVLCKFYQLQRNRRDRDQSRTTIRLLESLVRLSQGHARLMCRTSVTAEDAVIAVMLWEGAMAAEGPSQGSPIDTFFGGTANKAGDSTLHAAFPENAQTHYRKQACELLQRLRLPDVLERELARLQDLESKNSNYAASLINAITEQKDDPIPPTIPVIPRSAPNDRSTQKQRASLTQKQRASFQRGLAVGTQDFMRRDIIEELQEECEEEGLRQKKAGANKSKRKAAKKGKKIASKQSIKDLLLSGKGLSKAKEKRIAVISSESEESSCDEITQRSDQKQTTSSSSSKEINIKELVNKGNAEQNSNSSLQPSASSSHKHASQTENSTTESLISNEKDVDVSNCTSNTKRKSESQYCVNHIKKLKVSDKSLSDGMSQSNSKSQSPILIFNEGNVSASVIRTNLKHNHCSPTKENNCPDHSISLTQKARGILEKFSYSKDKGKSTKTDKSSNFSSLCSASIKKSENLQANDKTDSFSIQGASLATNRTPPTDELSPSKITNKSVLELKKESNKSDCDEKSAAASFRGKKFKSENFSSVSFSEKESNKSDCEKSGAASFRNKKFKSENFSSVSFKLKKFSYQSFDSDDDCLADELKERGGDSSAIEPKNAAVEPKNAAVGPKNAAVGPKGTTEAVKTNPNGKRFTFQLTSNKKSASANAGKLFKSRKSSDSGFDKFFSSQELDDLDF